MRRLRARDSVALVRGSILAFVASLVLAVSGLEGLAMAIDPRAGVCDDDGCSDCGECGDCIHCAQPSVLPCAAAEVPSDPPPARDVAPTTSTGVAPSDGAARELLRVPRA